MRTQHILLASLAAVLLTLPGATAAPPKPDCGASPTWPGGGAGCTVGETFVGCSVWTGATLLGDPERVACGATGCPAPGSWHTDGIVAVGGQGCVVYVWTGTSGGGLLDLLADLVEAVAVPPA